MRTECAPECDPELDCQKARIATGVNWLFNKAPAARAASDAVNLLPMPTVGVGTCARALACPYFNVHSPGVGWHLGHTYVARPPT